MGYGGGNPQLEDGFARIANEILEATARTTLTDYQSRCVHLLWRKTYGWQNKSGKAKKTDTIAYGQWAEGTAIDRRAVRRTLQTLVDRHIFTKGEVRKAGKNPINIWGFQKKYTDWVGYIPVQVGSSQPPLPVQVGSSQPLGAPQPPLPVQVGTVVDKVGAPQPPEVGSTQPPTKDTLKDNTIDKVQAQGSKKTPDPLHPLRQKVFEELKKRRGYNSPLPGAEAAAITWMLKQGYSVEQILTAHDKLKKDKFWAGKLVDMQTVKKQVGELVKGKKAGQLPTTEELKKSWFGGEDGN